MDMASIEFPYLSMAISPSYTLDTLEEYMPIFI
jgi:hypothetical protein